MTPQSNFMILAPILTEREGELRELLASMNHGPGQVDPTNPIVPFGAFDNLHFARLLILDDQTVNDAEVHGLAPRSFPRYLAVLGDVDGGEDEFLGELVRQAGDGLRRLFECCVGFQGGTDLLQWMKRHRSPPVANYVNCRGRTVRQVHAERKISQVVADFISSNEARLSMLGSRDVHAAVKEFVESEREAGRLVWPEELPSPLGWKIRNAFHLVSWPLVLLVASPLLVVAAPFYFYLLRKLEKSDPELCDPVARSYSDRLSESEDREVTNQFSAMGSLKPGAVRLLTIMGVLGTVDYAARHIVRPGRLGRIRTIHFARWVFLDDRKRMVFFSNYDGSVESYMDDFINKTGFGLNASFSNGIGYPRTNWLVLDGCADERKYKEYLRRHTVPTLVWYKAYPGLTAVDLERNTRIRQGLELKNPTSEEAREWVALL